MIEETNRVRWRFGEGAMFPGGYVMAARSIVLDVEGQRKTLGRAIINDRAKALRLLEIVGEKGPILDAVRAYRKTGDPRVLRELQPNSPEDLERLAEMRRMLLQE